MREADIRPADLLAEYLRLNALDAQAMLAEPSGLVHRACPGCTADQPVAAFVKNGFQLARCGACATLYAVDCPTDERLAAFYRDSASAAYWAKVFFPAVEEARRSLIFTPRARQVLDLLPAAPRRVVDVGAGNGLFLSEFARVAPAAALAAVEPGTAAAAACRAKGFDTFEGMAAAAAADPAWAGQADLVTCFEVIEHVPDPAAFLADLAALARPGGMVVVSGLSGTGFDIMVLAERSKAVSPPHHVNFLSRKGAARLIERVGLEEVAFLTPGKLDVDIVLNVLRHDDGAVTEPFLRHLLLEAGDDARAHFQAALAESGLSSHMWLVARRPGAR